MLNRVVSVAGALGLMALALLPGAEAQQANVCHKYDALGRVIETIYGNGNWVTFAYDAAGNRTQVSTGTGKSCP